MKDTNNNNNLDSMELRNTFGKYATGVAVITCQVEGQAPMGMTINSFSSLSLDPPLMLWSLQKNSDMYDAIMASPRFAVNILAADQQHLSRQYAKKNEHALHEKHYHLSDAGRALLNGCLVSLECDMETHYEGGDHLILVGRIQAISNISDGEPLLFFGGGYRQLAE